MRVHLGVKSDPIESRYSFDWLFDLMAGCGVYRMQLGTFFNVFLADDGYFRNLRDRAEHKGIRISSVFSAHRELDGFMGDDPYLEAASRRAWERAIRVAALLGADSFGSAAGPVLRDRPQDQGPGRARYFRHMKELMAVAKKAGLKAITLEPMSSRWEFPSTPDEIRMIADELGGHHYAHRDSTVPMYYCADISHGVADENRAVVCDNWEMFELEIPQMWEFHFKNTDSIYNATFGFSAEEQRRGIIDLDRLAALIQKNADRFPAEEITGYLELPGPKIGRDYTDCALEAALVASLDALKKSFSGGEPR